MVREAGPLGTTFMLAAAGGTAMTADLGSRTIRFGHRGWDVAALQFLLAWHGFPSGTLDGDFGPRTGRALHLYQGWRGELVYHDVPVKSDMP